MIHEIKAYQVNDFCRVMGIGRSTVYELIANGEINAIRIAGRRLIPASEADRLIAKALLQTKVQDQTTADS